VLGVPELVAAFQMVGYRVGRPSPERPARDRAAGLADSASTATVFAPDPYPDFRRS